MKLVTAAVALEVLGPDHRFTTEAQADQAPAGGIARREPLPRRGRRPGARHEPVRGRGRGAGDASAAVRHADGDAGRPDRRRRGHPITGSVIGDDSRYDAERFVPSWPASYATSREAGPLGALLVNDAAETLAARCAARPTRRSTARASSPQLLRERGVTVAGAPGRGRDAGRRAVGVGASRAGPLAELIGELLTTSDDNTAELLLKEIGATGGRRRHPARRPGRGAGEAGGVGDPPRRHQPRRRVGARPRRPADLRGAAGRAAPRRRHAGRSPTGCPSPARPGTLSDGSSPGNPAVGRLRAKTGTLRDAKALSGFVDSPDGSRHVSFSYIQNGAERGGGGGAGLGRPRPGPHRLPDRAARRPARPRCPLRPAESRTAGLWRPDPAVGAWPDGLPMFPLGTVLFPGALLPLHVFEERYRQLVKDCLAGEPEFGVVLIDRGHEVGGGDVRREVGTVARILEVAELPDGRYFLQAAGVRRIRVQAWLDDAPYPAPTWRTGPTRTPAWPPTSGWPRSPTGPGGCGRWPASCTRAPARSRSTSRTTPCWPATTSARWLRWARTTATSCWPARGRSSGSTASTTSWPTPEMVLQLRLEQRGGLTAVQQRSQRGPDRIC